MLANLKKIIIMVIQDQSSDDDNNARQCVNGRSMERWCGFVAAGVIHAS